MLRAHARLAGRLRASTLSAWLVAAAGCGTGHGVFKDGIYRDRALSYRVGPLPAPWRKVGVTVGNAVFTHPHGGTIAALASCGGPGEHHAEVPLDILTNHLLLGFEDRRAVSRRALVLDGRRALRTRWQAALEGVPVELSLVVVKKDGCVFDLQLITAPGAHDRLLGAFDSFVSGFGTLRTPAVTAATP